MASSAAPADTRESDQPTYGGYDYKFAHNIPRKYTCSICTKVLRDAHLTDCCSQHFCASCLTHWLGTQQGQKTCPHCQQIDFQHKLDEAILHDVNNLKIHCTNHSKGCKWKGDMRGLKNHLDSDKGCGYVVVTCTKGCGGRMSRKDLQTHLQEKCFNRPYKCEYCGHEDTHRAITGYEGHYFKCPEYPLDCPNSCGKTGIKRRAMTDHRSSCPREPLQCLFKDVGCTDKVAREDMEIHMKANQQKHILQGYSSLQQSFEQLKQEFHDTKQDLEVAKQKLQDTTVELHTTKQNLLEDLETTKQNLLGDLETTKQDLLNTKKHLQTTKHELSIHKQDLRWTKQELQIVSVGLSSVGDTLKFQVCDFSCLRREGKEWHSLPFSIGGKVRVCLAVYPSGIGRGRGSHVSVSLILVEVVKKERGMEDNVSVTAIGQRRSATSKELELCTYSPFFGKQCSAYSPLPSSGEVLQSKERFLKREEATSLLQNDAMILELKLLEHHHH